MIMDHLLGILEIKPNISLALANLLPLHQPSPHQPILHYTRPQNH